MRHRGWLAIGALILMLSVLAVISNERRQPEGSAPPLSSHSNQPDGARALALWLHEIGYRSERIEFQPFRLDHGIDALFVLAPTRGFEDGEVTETLRWVRSGGTLVVATEQDNALLQALDAVVRAQSSFADTAAPVQPVFSGPPLRSITIDGGAVLRLAHPDWVAVLGDGDETTVGATRQLGAGRVFVLASEYTFSNVALNEADNAALTRHVLAGLPHGSRVVFDEYHHGLTEHGTLNARLVREPWGWAILYSITAVFAWTAFAGKRFGRAVPPVPPGTRRSSAEYVSTLGGLLRRGNHGDWLRQHYVAQVKRALGARFRVPSDQPTPAFVAAIALRRPEARALEAPLTRLEQGAQLDEHATIALMREVDAVTRTISGNR